MSTHNMYLSRNKKNIGIFWVEIKKNTLSRAMPYHTYPKKYKSLFYYLLMCIKHCWLSGK